MIRCGPAVGRILSVTHLEFDKIEFFLVFKIPRLTFGHADIFLDRYAYTPSII